MNSRRIKMPGRAEDRAIQKGIKQDPDTVEVGDAFFSHAVRGTEPVDIAHKVRGRPRSEQRKLHINIRLSPEVVEIFKAEGKGWQTRIDEALKEWVREHRAA